MSDCLRPHGLQHARLLCPPLSPWVYSNSCPLIWWCHPTNSSCVALPPPVLSLPQHQGLFKGVDSCIRWPKYWSFSFSISPSREYSGLISFRIDFFDLLALQGTFKSLLQHHNLKASFLQCSPFSMVQLSHPYINYWKDHNLDYMELWQKKICLCFLIHCLGLSYLFFQGASVF